MWVVNLEKEEEKGKENIVYYVFVCIVNLILVFVDCFKWKKGYSCLVCKKKVYCCMWYFKGLGYGVLRVI